MDDFSHLEGLDLDLGKYIETLSHDELGSAMHCLYLYLLERFAKLVDAAGARPSPHSNYNVLSASADVVDLVRRWKSYSDARLCTPPDDATWLVTNDLLKGLSLVPGIQLPAAATHEVIANDPRWRNA